MTQGFFKGDTVWSDIGFFDLKIYASIVANAFCGLHNDKYTKYSPHKNGVIRACIELLRTGEKFKIS
jgi:hypothetical protein